MDEKRNISWKEFYTLSQKLFEKLKDVKFDEILVVLNGGFFPAYELNKRFKVPMNFIGISSYHNEKQYDLSLYLEPKLDIEKTYLVIDDICDTGDTLTFIQSLYPENKLIKSSLVSYKENIIWGELLTEKKWINFPWE